MFRRLLAFILLGSVVSSVTLESALHSQLPPGQLHLEAFYSQVLHLLKMQLTASTALAPPPGVCFVSKSGRAKNTTWPLRSIHLSLHSFSFLFLVHFLSYLGYYFTA